ncbi:unnamed protein product [Urochloa humidicola]
MAAEEPWVNLGRHSTARRQPHLFDHYPAAYNESTTHLTSPLQARSQQNQWPTAGRTTSRSSSSSSSAVSSNKNRRRRRRGAYVLLLPIPWPGMQGHTSLMLQRGRLLAHHGLGPRLVTTCHDLSTPATTPRPSPFRAAAISEGFNDGRRRSATSNPSGGPRRRKLAPALFCNGPHSSQDCPHAFLGNS